MSYESYDMTSVINTRDLIFATTNNQNQKAWRTFLGLWGHLARRVRGQKLFNSSSFGKFLKYAIKSSHPTPHCVSYMG